MLNLSNILGYTLVPVVLFTGHHDQILLDNFVYRHLGGIIVFTSDSDLIAYKTDSSRSLQQANNKTRG